MVAGQHVSSESVAVTERRAHLRMLASRCATRESSPPPTRVHVPSVFGHVSQLSSLLPLDDVIAPRLRRSAHMQVNAESEARVFEVKSGRRKVKGREVGRESEEVDAKPSASGIRLFPDRFASKESDVTSQDDVDARFQRFKG